MLTILTSFKTFVGDDASRQVLALRSWRVSFPGCEIVAFGLPPVPESIVEQFAIRQIFDIPMHENRLVRVDAMLDRAAALSGFALQMYVNGDMILGPDMAAALRRMPPEKLLSVGQRYDAGNVPAEAVRNSETLAAFANDARHEFPLHPAAAMDYFVFRKGAFHGVKPLYVGTVGWDNYMVGYALSQRMKVVDLTPSVAAVHQNHGYSAYPGGWEDFSATEISRYNRQMLNSLGSAHVYSTTDATHEMVGGKVVPARKRPMTEQRVRRLHARYPALKNSRLPWKLRYLYCWANLYAGMGRTKRGLREET